MTTLDKTFHVILGIALFFVALFALALIGFFINVMTAFSYSPKVYKVLDSFNAKADKYYCKTDEGWFPCTKLYEVGEEVKVVKNFGFIYRNEWSSIED